MSNEALVSTQKLGGRTHVLQKYNRQAIPNEISEIWRTPALFALGLLESSSENMSDGTKLPIFGAFLERNSLEDVIANALANELGVSSNKYCASIPEMKTISHDCKPLISDSELADLVQFVRFSPSPH